MESFCSLFDPSDGQNKPAKKKERHKLEQDSVKKKIELPKGRRRGRKSQCKNETLPEESSFLCEPEISTELLVKDVSYIESFFEVNKREDDTKIDDKKPKRRNSGRKNRRRKSKVSPFKETSPNYAWFDGGGPSWNNQTSKHKNSYESIGKNVNDFTKINDNFRRKDLDLLNGEDILDNSMRDVNKNTFDNIRMNKLDAKCQSNKYDCNPRMENKYFQDLSVYNVIDKLEKVSLKDDMYLAGDFNTEELESELFYSSDDLDDAFDDTTSEPEASSEEAYGSLPPEPRFGNVEYKLQLVSPCERRFQHLVTQLKWRLRSGGGSAVYVLGVRDCGALCGLRARALRGSLYTLRRMAAALGATLTHVTARRVAPHRAVAEVYIRKLADTQQSVELRIAVMGADEAGKSTLIGVLTQGELDNGRGSARLNMFRHLHEVKSGRTSSLSHEILGFDAQGSVVNYGCSELMTAERIGERSAKLVSFLDLAGHSKYQRTTLHGLTGYSPHYAMLVISATAGITPITEEHIGILVALESSFFIVINKCELAPTASQALVDSLRTILQQYNKKPLLITDEHLARNCVAPQKLILDTIDNGDEDVDNDKQDDDELQIEQIPVFPVSCVRGVGLNALHAYLLALQLPTVDVQPKPEDETCEFQIDEIFHVGDSTGPVVGGLLARGLLYEGSQLIIGPLDTGEFMEISVKTIYRNRVPCGMVKAGQSASLGLSYHPTNLRPGMVLLAIPENYRDSSFERPTFGGCHHGKCKSKNEVESAIAISHKEIIKNKKIDRRKNKNILLDLAHVETSLAKDITNITPDNIFGEDKDQKKFYKVDEEKLDLSASFGDEFHKIKEEDDKCSCYNEVLLEDPNDPRGCLYFQATVHVLRHSTAIYPGFQCTVHVGNVRQTAIIEGIMSRDNTLRSGEIASVVFRFARCPEYLVRGRRMLFTAGLGTRAKGRITQTFPYVP